MAFNARLLTIFPPYDEYTPWIDDALWRRASMVGKLVVLQEKLVLYRIYLQNTSSDGMGRGKKRFRFLRQRWLDLFYAMQKRLVDMSLVKTLICGLLKETIVCFLQIIHLK